MMAWRLPLSDVLEVGARAHHDAAAAGAVALVHAGDAVDDAGGREVRRRHELDQLLDVDRRGCASSARQASIDLAPGCAAGCWSPCRPRCPSEPLISRFGICAGRTVGSLLLAVVVGDEVDGLLVDVGQQLGGDALPGGTRCSAWPRRCRRRPSRSCPGRRSAGSAGRSPAPCAPACRRSRCRRAGGTCRSRRRRCARTSRTAGSRRCSTSCIANRTRRCTGFRPSRTSGSARPTITLIA